MSGQPQDNREAELAELVQGLLDGVLTDGESARLEALLAEPHLLRCYVRLMMLAALLQESEFAGAGPRLNGDGDLLDAWFHALAETEQTAPTVDVPRPPEPKVHRIKPARRSSVSRSNLWTALVSSAALIALLVYAHIGPIGRAVRVATVTGAIECRWMGDERLGIGDRLTDHDPVHVLREGFVEVTFDNGAVVVIEAPARFAVEEPAKLLLQRGRLTANVRADLVGFVVRTPLASVVDYGTEFGVEVKPDGRTEAHVFKGQVELRAGADPVVHGPSQRLTSEEAARVDVDGVVRRIATQPQRFVRRMPSAYELAVRRMGPLAYWRYMPEEQRFINLVGPGRSESIDDAMLQPAGGVDSAQGRRIPAVSLAGVADRPVDLDCTRLAFDETASAYTIMLWVRPDGAGPQDVVATRIEKPNEVYWRQIRINADRRFEQFFIRPDMGQGGSKITSLTEVEPRRWYHVVVTASSQGGQKRLYVNGVLDCTPFRMQAKRLLGAYRDVWVGHVPDAIRSKDAVPFKGRIGEIVLFDRALSAGEIRRLWDAAKTR